MWQRDQSDKREQITKTHLFVLEGMIIFEEKGVEIVKNSYNQTKWNQMRYAPTASQLMTRCAKHSTECPLYWALMPLFL